MMKPLQTNNFGLLIGARVAWAGRHGKRLSGTVTAYRACGDTMMLQVRRSKGRGSGGKHLWFRASDIEDHNYFAVIEHSNLSLEYGLDLAARILRGDVAHLPADSRIMTLAATVTALETQLEQMKDALKTPSEHQPSMVERLQ